MATTQTKCELCKALADKRDVFVKFGAHFTVDPKLKHNH